MTGTVRRLVCALWVLATACCACGAATLTPLGFLPSGGNSGAAGVSADGSVVVGSTSVEAFRWTAGSGMVALGDLPGGIFASQGQDVSADGSVVVGFGNTASFNEAFRWTSGEGMVGLGFAPGGTASGAFGVSANGSVIVGTSSSDSIPGGQAARWTAGPGAVGMGFLPGDTSSAGFDVSADGSVVVGRSSLGASHRAFRWTAGSGMVALGSGIAHGVSADGSVVVGKGASGQGFRWTAGSGMVEIGILPGIYTTFESTARAASADGSVVVGSSNVDAAMEWGFVWTADTGTRRLWDVLLANGVDPAAGGWTGLDAFDISADGKTIVGYGRRNGRQEAFLAVVPEPASLGLMALAAAGLTLRCRGRVGG